MLRVAIITKKGTVRSLNAETRDKIDEFLIKIDDKEGIKRFRVINKETGEVLETDKGRKDKKEEI